MQSPLMRHWSERQWRRRNQGIRCEPGNQGLCSPAAEGRIHGQACAAQGTTPQAGEIGLHRGLVYENHAFRPIRDGWQAMLEPVGSPLSYPGTAAFGGHQRLFL